MRFIYQNNTPINPGIIPIGTTHLVFNYDFIQPLIPNCIPTSVTHIIFGNFFNQPLTPNCIPSSVTHITFGIRFNQPLIPNCIPSSTTHIRFGYIFNQPLTYDCIPPSIKYLYFGRDFDYKSSASEIIMNPEIEINFNATNKFYPKNRVVYLFYFGHGRTIPRVGIDMEETIVDDEQNEYMNGEKITKIRLTPKILLQSCIKSATKV